MRFLAITVLSTLLLAGVQAQAQKHDQTGELDNESKVTNEQLKASKELPQTLVVRKNDVTGEVQVMHSAEKLSGTADQSVVTSSNFVKVDASQVVTGELDQDSSRSSWYFCFNNGWNYPQYNYWGYNYNYNYYSGYSWGGWNYSYYRWNTWGWY